ncbi:BlaI/MecI/CopY family transcriptional regulator [Puniceicoccaceae bacterium K14]|nr:BlaI/MecI/CopY family transcriptional regulator [Puniceicoccaceae bacterium K14]
MEKGPKISDSEWEVMKVLWDHEPMTAVEVLEQLSHEQWKQKTVNTFLARLESKAIIESTREGRANVYTTILSERQCCREEGKHFLEKVFRGKVAPMMLHFIENEDVSEEDLAELKHLLDKRGT